MTSRVHTQAVRKRMQAGETVSEAEYVDAVIADVTRADLDALAMRLTASTGISHAVYRDARGSLAVYPACYVDALGLTLAEGGRS